MTNGAYEHSVTFPQTGYMEGMATVQFLVLRGRLVAYNACVKITAHIAVWFTAKEGISHWQ